MAPDRPMLPVFGYYNKYWDNQFIKWRRVILAHSVWGFGALSGGPNETVIRDRQEAQARANRHIHRQAAKRRGVRIHWLNFLLLDPTTAHQDHTGTKTAQAFRRFTQDPNYGYSFKHCWEKPTQKVASLLNIDVRMTVSWEHPGPSLVQECMGSTRWNQWTGFLLLLLFVLGFFLRA